MPSAKEQQILRLVETARKEADALIVVGIMPGDRIFYSCDDRVPMPDLHGTLRRNVDFICESVARTRQERKSR